MTRFVRSYSHACVLLAVSCGGGAPPPAQGSDKEPTVRLELLAESSERPEGMRPVGDEWSMYDDRDSLVVRATVVNGAALPRGGSGLLMVEVEVQAAWAAWADTAHEVLDRKRMLETGVWLPAILAASVPLDSARRNADESLSVDVATAYPLRIAERLGSHAPSTQPVRLRASVYLLAPGEPSAPARRSATRTILLYTVE